MMPPWAWPGGPEKLYAKLKFADVALALGTECEVQVQSAGICRTATKTDIPLPALRGYIVIMRVLPIHQLRLRSSSCNGGFHAFFDSA